MNTINDTELYTKDISTAKTVIYHIKTKEQWKNLPMVSIWIDNCQVQALLDSDSEINLVQEDIAKLFQLQENVSSVNDNATIKVECGGEVNTSNYLIPKANLKLRAKRYESTFYVIEITPNIPKIILGMPWLRENRIVFHFTQNEYCIMDQMGNIIEQVNDKANYNSNFQLSKDVSSNLTLEPADSDSILKNKEDTVTTPEKQLPSELLDLAAFFAKPDYNGKLPESNFKTFIEFESIKPTGLGTTEYLVPQNWITQESKYR